MPFVSLSQISFIRIAACAQARRHDHDFSLLFILYFISVCSAQCCVGENSSKHFRQRCAVVLGRSRCSPRWCCRGSAARRRVVGGDGVLPVRCCSPAMPMRIYLTRSARVRNRGFIHLSAAGVACLTLAAVSSPSGSGRAAATGYAFWLLGLFAVSIGCRSSRSPPIIRCSSPGSFRQRLPATGCLFSLLQRAKFAKLPCAHFLIPWRSDRSRCFANRSSLSVLLFCS